MEDVFKRFSKQINPFIGGLANFVEQQQALQETVQRSLDPIHHAALHFAEQYLQIEKGFSKLAQQSEMERSIEHIVEQQRQIELAIKRTISPIHDTFQRLAQEGSLLEKALQRSFTPMLQTIDHFAKQYRQVEDTFKQVADQISKEQDLFRFAEQAGKLRDLFGLAITERFSKIPLENVATLFSQLDKISTEISTKSFEITPNGAALKVEGQSVSLVDANAQIEEFISRSTSLAELAKAQDKFADRMEAVLAEIKKLKSPIQLLIFSILIPVVLSLLTDFYIKPYLESEFRRLGKKEIERKIQEEAISLGLQEEDLKNLRMVITSVLNVRNRSGKNNSKVIGALYHGQIVMLLSIDRDWSLVEFSEDNVRLRGWVFSRYLEVINLPHCQSIKRGKKGRRRYRKN
jgi:hypothetical protein